MNGDKRQLKPYQGVLVFALSILMLIFVATGIQVRWGLYGVALTELLILLLGILPAILLKADLKEIFPIKRPKLRQVFGVVMLWVGSSLIVTIVSLILGYFFPESYTNVSNALQEVFTSVPMLISFLIVAVSPAICEEVLVRGFILSSMYPIKRKWLIIIIMGILFGIFHLDPIRFLPTAILGMVLTYIMMETKNILLPALFHFINNGFSTIVSFLIPVPTQDTSVHYVVPRISIGVYLVIGTAASFLFLWGARLLQEKVQPVDEEIALRLNRQKWKHIWIASGISGVMLVSGVAITMVSFVQNFNSGNDINITEQVNQDTENFSIDLPVKQTGDYSMYLKSECERGLVLIDIVDASGKSVYHTEFGKYLTIYDDIALNQGMYHVNLDFLMTQEELEKKGFKYDDSLIENLNLKGDLSEMLPLKFELSLNKAQ